MTIPATTALPGVGTEVLQTFAQHRLLTTGQVHAIHTPNASLRWTRHLLAELERAHLAAHVRVHGTRRLWHITRAGADLLGRLPDPAHQPAKVLTSQQAAGQLWRHTLAVNDVGIAFLHAARQRGDEFGALSWRHEVAHRLTTGARRSRLVVADALITYLLSDRGEVALEYRFLELDRATLTVDRLTAKLARYARLYRDRDQHGHPTWERRYLAFPAVMVVLADQPRRLLERRARSVAALCRTDPELERTPDVTLLFGLLEDLIDRGPFAPIFHAPANPDQPINWLHQPATREGAA